MIELKTNNKTYKASQTDEGIEIDGQAIDWDLLEVTEGRFHVIWNHESYQAEVVEANYQEKTFKIKVNGHQFEIQAKDRFDLLLDKLGMSDANKAKINNLKAPMPGLVLEVVVAVGDEVQKGDKLLILEAMKMENVLKATGEGRVKSIEIEKGNNVEKGQVLISFE